MSRPKREPLGLTLPQHLMLYVLYNEPTGTKLPATGPSRQTATSLQKMGLVIAETNSHGELHVQLTRKGRELIK